MSDIVLDGIGFICLNLIIQRHFEKNIESTSSSPAEPPLAVAGYFDGDTLDVCFLDKED